ncbi:alkaline phosphatase D [Acrocarpospora phusangensis]|uniref:Alkaline phosphatase D n=1 Tax=Acrocarpospora phusangensis TaxID=1070424 RepID=A0A919Q9Q7_9ACTN|nr:alkaline phosphatase D family protein [Acrocarpospora phusangensis]GIH23784.1 alkaline phosphatase D [Acrocarpospora phusangensis]
MSGVAAGGLLLTGAGYAPTRSPARSLRQDPFGVGLASGDPSADGFVLWTRLVLDPLGLNGRGGMPARDYDVQWQVATDERFADIVRTGTETAAWRSAHSVHVELQGLQPGREYFYRFRADGHVSPAGRTRTSPAGLSPLTFAIAACAHYEHGYYTAYKRLAEQEPDLVVHLGDYMYEYQPDGYTAPGGNIRHHSGGQKCATLADYRMRHAQYKSDPDLQAAHAVAPWLVAFDDHEIENNWAGEKSSSGAPAFERRRASAFQAYYENMPLRRASLPHGAAIKINRRVAWGDLAQFHLLDTRQFRDDQACEDGVRAGCDDRLDEKRTLLGQDQHRWLLSGLKASQARWNLIGQQILMAQKDYKLGPGSEVNLDSWDGYAAERASLLRGLKDVANPVVLTGDAHMHHAAELHADPGDPDSKAAVELVTSSIASDGDGYRDVERTAAVLAENPHISYIDQRRGYILARLTPDTLTADFRTLDYISRRGAPARTSARFTVPSGERSLV